MNYTGTRDFTLRIVSIHILSYTDLCLQLSAEQPYECIKCVIIYITSSSLFSGYCHKCILGLITYCSFSHWLRRNVGPRPACNFQLNKASTHLKVHSTSDMNIQTTPLPRLPSNSARKSLLRLERDLSTCAAIKNYPRYIVMAESKLSLFSAVIIP